MGEKKGHSKYAKKLKMIIMKINFSSRNSSFSNSENLNPDGYTDSSINNNSEKKIVVYHCVPRTLSAEMDSA